MEGVGGNKNEIMSIEDVGEYKTKVDMIELREMKSLRQNVDEEDHLKIYGGLIEGMGMKTCLHGPIDYAKNFKLRFRIGDLDLPERRGLPVVEWRKKMHRLALLAKQAMVEYI